MTHGQTKTRLDPIQWLRGIAVALVVLVHAINMNDFRHANGLDSHRAWLAGAGGLNEFGASGVDLFFVISGFVMAMMVSRRQDLTPSRFARERIIRIVPLFWLISALFALARPLADQHYPVGELVTAFTIMPIYGDYVSPVLVVGWSLAFELAFYSLVAATLCLRHSLRFPALILALLAFIGAGFALPDLGGFLSIFFNPIFIEFLLGVLVFLLWNPMHRTAHHPKPIGYVFLLIGSAVLAATLIEGFNFPTSHISLIAGDTGLTRSLFWGAPWAFVVFGLLLIFSRRATDLPPGLVATVLGKLGDASYSIYLVHLFACMAWENAVPVHALDPDVMIAMAFVSAIALGFACHKWLEKPLLEYFGRENIWPRKFSPVSRPEPALPKP